MKMLSRRILTLLLALCLLLSVASPSLALDIRYNQPPKSEAMDKELDQQPVPHVSSKPKFLLLFQSANTILMVPLFYNSATVSTKSWAPKTSNPSRADGQNL